MLEKVNIILKKMLEEYLANIIVKYILINNII